MPSDKYSKALRLQTRLIIYSTLLILILMSLVIVLVEKSQRKTIEDEVKKRGVAIAHNLASLSTNALLTYNYVVLEQNGEKVALEEDIAYIIVHDKENRVAVYSQHDEKQGTILADEVSKRAVGTSTLLIQPTFYGEMEEPILDISIPVYIKESKEKWGTVRVGLSLERMSGQILKTRIYLLLLGFFAILFGTMGSIFFARRITQPISTLVDITISAAKGDLEQEINIRTGDEIEELSRNFSHMIEQIRLHRNELENQLREIVSLKAYNDNILSSMTNGMITIDLENRVVTLNKMAERLLEKRSEEVIGFPLAKALGPQHPFHGMMMETLFHAKGISYSELKLKKGEEILWLIAGTSLLTDGEGKKIGALMVFQDITEIKALEEKLRRSDRLAALGSLSAGLAHEIRNPLSAIKTFVQLLPKKSDNSSFMEKFHITVPREVDRINQLVEDLLELTRTRKRTLVSLDVNHLMTQVIDLHGEEMKKRKVALEDHLDRTIPQIQGDPEQIYRALSNLVINSIQAMPTGGLLSISSRHENSKAPVIKIIILDTGIGMDETTSQNLFSPFFTTKDKGVGLGMALTRKIVEDHNGTIEVSSEKGKGSTFVLKFHVVRT
jgi:PAS domain S-box-containing protein